MKKEKTQEKLNVGARFKGIPLRRDTTVPLKQQKGITLIALVITIIVLLILAGVTLSIVFNGGIINKSQTAVEAYDEGSARESLQIELVALMAEKLTNKDYNKDAFLDNKITNDGFTISGDMVIVDGYKFIIDRDKLQIVSSLGKGVENNNIRIILSQNISTDYTKSIVSITVTSDKALDYIEVNGTKITDYTENNGTYTLNDIEVTENKTVSVLVQDIDKGYKINSIQVSELSENLQIRTLAELEEFRDGVNAGRTYENRTITLMNDIDLNEDKYTIGTDGTITFASTATQWIPIGNKEKRFKGTFDGMYHIISGLYINNSEDLQALFGGNYGTIQNLILKNGYVNANQYVGGICAYNNDGGIIKRCYNEMNVCGGSYVGGICGVNYYSNIEECINEGKITNGNTISSYGGIVAYTNHDSLIRNCYNTGNITGYSVVGGIIGGVIGKNTKVLNCYNIGNVGGNIKVGEICGINGQDSAYPGASVENCFYKKGKTAVGKTYSVIKNETFAFEDNAAGIADMLSKLGDAFVADEKDKDGNWIYNNGYPILKWQKEHNVVNK